jgi:CheY-like chemotaxis protein
MRKGVEPAADIDAIENAGQRAAELTRQLLAFSRRQAYQPKVVDVAGLFDRFRPMVRTLAGGDIPVETSFAPDAPHVLADPGQLEQILLNLLVNARDAVNEKADPAGRWISIRLGAAEHALPQGSAAPPARCLLIEVADGGAGMTPEVRSRIFEPFFTTKETGTGMGLATVYGIVRQNGGDVEVESAPGNGTRIRVYWPASGETLRPDPGADESPGGGTECVLLVEDEEAVRAFARAALSSLGYRVLEADSGPEALAVLGSHSGPVDALVTDLAMPAMGGRELADRVRQVRPGLPVLFTTGYDREGISLEGALPDGMHVLLKPFSEAQLALKLREVLRRASPGDSRE